MTIRFNRDQVQNFWNTKAEGRSDQPLSKALRDNQLSKAELTELKTAFESENPGQDFENWISDALDGQLDQRVNSDLKAAIQKLSQSGSAVLSISLELNDSGQGFASVVSSSYQNEDWLAAMHGADSNQNGRIEASEAPALRGKVDPELLKGLDKDAVLTFDTEQRSMRFYPARENPSLHGRYRDLKADLQLNLKDVDGISDTSRSDISGKASGELHFDWSGPLTTSIARGVTEKSHGVFDSQARYVPAGDKEGYGPGYVIQAGNSWVATRPIVLKSDSQGQLFIESPGFGEWARLKMGEYGLTEYALPQLKAMGFEMEIEKRDNRIYLKPKSMEVNQVPLSAQGEAGGQIKLNLEGRVHFSVGPDGLRARLDQVPVSGSSNPAGALAIADLDTQGQLAPDALDTHLQVGLNYHPDQQKLDSQVIVKASTAVMDLTAAELERIPYLPTDLKQLAGDHLRLQLQTQGAYRTINGQPQAGNLQGQISATRRQGDQITDVFSRFKANGLQAASLSAVDIRHQRAGEQFRVRAEQGRVTVPTPAATPHPPKSPKAQAIPAALELELHQVSSQADLKGPLLERLKGYLRGPQPVALQLQSALKQMGIQPKDLAVLSQGSDQEIADLLSTKRLADKIEQAFVSLDAERVVIKAAAQLGVEAQGLTVSGRAGNSTNTRIQGQGQIESLSSEIDTASLDLTVTARQANLQAEIGQSQGTANTKGKASLQATELNLEASQGSLSAAARHTDFDASIELNSSSGTVLKAAGKLEQIDAQVNVHADDQELQLKAQSGQGQVSYRAAGGSQISSDLKLQDLDLKQNAQREWTLTADNIDAQSRLTVDMGELRQLLARTDREKLVSLAQSESPEALSAGLASLDTETAEMASRLLKRPELHQLLASSELLNALEAGQTIRVELASQGTLHASDSQADGFQLKAQLDHQAQARLENATGQVLIQGDAQLDTAIQVSGSENQVLSTDLQAHLTGFRPDGSVFGTAQARLTDLKAQLGPALSLETGAIHAEASANTHLDPETMAHLQDALGEFRDQILTHVAKLGLNRQQFEQILQAFGKQQLDSLIKAFKTENLGALSADLGLSSDQVNKTLALLNDAPFQKLVQDFFEYSNLLSGSELNSGLQVDAKNSSWSQADQKLLAEINGIQGRFSAQTENAQGQGHLQVDLSQQQVRYQRSEQGEALDWQPFDIRATGDLAAKTGSRSIEANAQLRTQAGQITRNEREISSRIDGLEIKAGGHQRQTDGSTADAQAGLSTGQIRSSRHLEQPDSAQMQIKNLGLSGKSEFNDTLSRQNGAGSASLTIEELELRPDQMEAQKTRLEAELRTRQLQGNQGLSEDQAKASATARFQIETDSLNSSPEAGFQTPELRVAGRLDTRLQSKQDEAITRMGVEVKSGSFQDLKAQGGEVSVDKIEAEIEGTARTPFVRGTAQGHLNVQGFQSNQTESRAAGFQFDQVNAKLHLDTDRLRDLLATSPDALAILTTVSERLVARQTAENKGDTIFSNPEVTLDIDQASLKGDASDGNALSGGQSLTAHLRVPDLQTQMGSGVLDLTLHDLTLAEGQRPEAHVSGLFEFKPKQPAFDVGVQALFDQSLKEAGMDLRPEVHFKNGKFEVKIDRWYVEGLVSLDFEGDQIKMTVDKAKLLHFLSAKGLAARFTESQLNHYLLDISRKGESMNLSLNEFSEQLLHKDNLQIQAVETRPNNTIGVRFAYTDTPAYNAGFKQRQQSKIEERLFQDPTSGQARSDGKLEDLLEDLAPVRLRSIFQQASPTQLRKMLAAVGNDYDNITRSVLADRNQFSRYPVANKAIMSAYLASSAGFLERVDSDEKELIKALYNGLSPSEKQTFQQALQSEEWQRVQQILNPQSSTRRPPRRQTGH